jgi:hypothetical protein
MLLEESAPGLDLKSLGIGAIIAAVIGGAVSLLLDQRRRNWEKKNRFLDNKLRAYKGYVQVCDLLVNDLAFYASILPILQSHISALIRSQDNKVSMELVALAERVEARGKKSDETQDELIKDAVTEIKFLAPLPVGEAAQGMLPIMRKIHSLISEIPKDDHLAIADMEVKLRTLKDEYKQARSKFLAQAQRDLGFRI